MSTLMNTLFVTTQGAYVYKEHETVEVSVDREKVMTVPLHHLSGLMCFGRVTMSPFLMAACAERGVAISFLSEQGKFLARVEGEVSGNVLLRRAQHRLADQEADALRIARGFVAGKIANSRALLQRGCREARDEADGDRLQGAVDVLGRRLQNLGEAESLDTLRGMEGDCASVYFSALDAMVKRSRETFNLERRTRRPPLDPLNALLSFLYTLVLHDVSSALQAVGLDPAVGYLHADRPGRLSLACDLMEEFRSVLADRLALSLINLQQVQPGGFTKSDSGAVTMDAAARKAVLVAYQARKREEVPHPFMKTSLPLGVIVHLQARLLARAVRGELDAYPPYVMR